MTALSLACPGCATPYAAGDRFCEECGRKLPVPAAATSAACACGSTEFDAEGYCLGCGTRRGAALPERGLVVIGPGLAAASDVGRRHERNEDAFALSGPAEGGDGTVLVVCDGVSRSQTPDLAAAAAVSVARDHLVAAMAAGDPESSDRASGGLAAAACQAIEVAHQTVCAIPYDRQHPLDPPAATIVVAAVRRRPDRAGGGRGRWAVTIGWLGDSRAYWISRAGEAVPLTRDHSWRNQMIDSGTLSEAEADRHPLAHAITKCLGTTDFAAPTPCPEPEVRTIDLSGEGWLLVCSDGLWNYATSPLALVQAAGAPLWRDDAADICCRLIAFANERGGMDNITVAMARLGMP